MNKQFGINALPDNTLTQIFLRKVEKQDLSAIVTIENQVQITPWSYSVLELSILTDEFYWVAVDQDQNKVVGFLICAIYSPDADLTNFGVACEYQNQGIGSKLLNNLWLYLNSKQIEKVTLEVRVSNSGAIKLYQRNNFVVVDKRKKYYRKNLDNEYEDCLIMTKYF